MCMKILRCRERQLSMLMMMMMVTVLVALLSRVVVAEENSRPPGLLNKVSHRLIRGFTSSDDAAKDHLRENWQISRRVLSQGSKNTEEKIHQEWNSIRKKEKKKGLNPLRKKMKIKKKNSPRKKIPAFIRRVVPLVASPAQQLRKKKDKKSKKTKSTTCGMAYNVSVGQKYKIRVSKSESCNIIFRAAKNTALKLSCSTIRVGNCTQGVLHFSDGGRLDTKYCGEPSNMKVSVKTLTELFVGYQPIKGTQIKAATPSVSCRIKGKKGTGYRATGLQQCPLSCGKTRADAEANKPEDPTVLTTAVTTAKPTTSTSTTHTNTTDTPSSTDVVDGNSTTPEGANRTSSSTRTSTSTIDKSSISISSSWNASSVNLSKLKLPWKFAAGGGNGKASQQTRVQGGKNASQGEWPWIVYVKVILGGSLLPCGGSIVSPRHILTAAHCVFDVVQTRGDKVIIVANEYNVRDKSETKRQKKMVSKIYLHPKYNSSTQNADIALLRLKSPLKLRDGVTPVCLAPDDDYVGSEVVLLGWGSLSYGGGDPDILQEATQRVDNLSECAKNYSSLPPSHTEYPITKKHLCASSPGVDSCLGDSGGPVIVKRGTSWYQVGIVSFGYRCAVAGYPGVNTFVPSYASWVYKKIKKDTCD